MTISTEPQGISHEHVWIQHSPPGSSGIPDLEVISIETKDPLYKYAFNKDFDFMYITDAPVNDTHFKIPFNKRYFS